MSHKERYVCAMFIDLSKAFGIIHHDLTIDDDDDDDDDNDKLFLWYG